MYVRPHYGGSLSIGMPDALAMEPIVHNSIMLNRLLPEQEQVFKALATLNFHNLTS
jgi:hypothetical protein